MPTDLMTTGQIADILDEPRPRIQYIITARKIKPVARVGIYRMFSSDQLEIIRQALQGIRIHRTHIMA